MKREGRREREKGYSRLQKCVAAGKTGRMTFLTIEGSGILPDTLWRSGHFNFVDVQIAKGIA